MNRIRKNIRTDLNRTPLWKQLIFSLTIILLLLTFTLSLTTYHRSRENAITSQIDKSDRLLDLKMTNLEKYIDELAAFCIQPCYDNELYSDILTTEALSPSEISNMKNAVRNYYYSRNDMVSYQIYLLNQDLAMGRSQRKYRIWQEDMPESEKTGSEIYTLCSESPYNSAILPSDDSSVFMNFSHAIIRVSDRKIMAIVTIDVASKIVKPYISRSSGSSESFCIFNPDGRVLYSDDPALPSDTAIIGSLAKRNDSEAGYLKLNNTNCLVTSFTGSKYGIKIVSMIPVSEITAQFRKTMQIMILQSILFSMIAILLVYIIIRYITAPLSLLASKQKDVGSGDFSSIDIGGCREISNLNSSFNEMTSHIDDLIKENYITQLNEKNARLAALEAQINPHFLYNTLQAIGSEALLNDQKNIYDMLTGLAQSLRYSIKAPNEVALSEEIEYVNNYIMLQTIRMEDHLTVTSTIDDDTLQARVPKNILQSLLENSIIHGISGDRNSINIKIHIYYYDDRLIMKVRDDGCGIQPEELARIRNDLKAQTLQDPGKGIGLANLNNRIKLMYDDTAQIEISTETSMDSYTEITVILPKETDKEIKEDEGSDNR